MEYDIETYRTWVLFMLAKDELKQIVSYEEYVDIIKNVNEEV